MHCIEVRADRLDILRRSLSKRGAVCTVLSRYSVDGVRYLDVEVSKDGKAITRIEEQVNGD